MLGFMRPYEPVSGCEGRGWLLEGVGLWREDRCPQHCDQVLPPKRSLKSHLRHSELIKEQQERHHGQECPPCPPGKSQNCSAAMPLTCSEFPILSPTRQILLGYLPRPGSHSERSVSLMPLDAPPNLIREPGLRCPFLQRGN